MLIKFIKPTLAGCKIEFFFTFHILFFSFNLFSNAQNSGIKYEYNSQSQLRESGVKEISIFSDDSSGSLKQIYKADKGGVIISHVRYDSYSVNVGPLFEEFSYSDTSSVYVRGRNGLSGSKIIYSTLSTWYSGTGKMLRKETEEHYDNRSSTIEIFDTVFEKGINFRKYVFHESVEDTLKKIVHYRDRDIELNGVYEKMNNVWNEIERTVTTYDSGGLYIQYEHYKNGILSNKYTREEREKVTEKTSDNFDESRNALPPGEPRIDTLFTNDINVELPVKNMKSGKYMVIVKYRNYNTKAESLSIYNSKRLILKYVYIPNKSANERFEYKYW